MKMAVKKLPNDIKRRWFVYLLRCRDGSLYAGITTDLELRLRRHNAGVGGKYTRSRLPVSLAWSEAAVSESAARRRELEIKGWAKAKKEALAA